MDEFHMYSYLKYVWIYVLDCYKFKNYDVPQIQLQQTINHKNTTKTSPINSPLRKYKRRRRRR
jgi:hypothetical protein